MLTRSGCRHAEHLPEVFKHPDSDVPIPYTELLITGTPGYKKRDAGMLAAPSKSMRRLDVYLRSFRAALCVLCTAHYAGMARGVTQARQPCQCE